LSQCIPLEEVDNSILCQGITLWGQLCSGRRFPARAEITPRELKPILRNTTLLRVIEGGRDYEYRIVGDAYVMAHGVSFQGRKWSETGQFSPGYHDAVKPVYDLVVSTGSPVATRGWIDKGKGAGERVYCEYVFLPLGTEEQGVDHILAIAVYIARPMIGSAL
jgi:hypothetical protein